jgi:hypothetical protein
VTDLVVNPKSVFLIVYPGGYCGEFLAWWLSQHPGCVATQHYKIGKNRYSGRHPYNYILDETGTQDKLFLTGHWPSNISKNGVVVSDPAQHIYLYATEKYHRFFNYLYMIKTIFYNYQVDKPQVVFKDKPLEWAEFVQSLNGQQTFIGAEMESWIHSRHGLGIVSWVEQYWERSSRYSRPSISNKLNYDISPVFFNNGCLDFCQQLNVASSNELESHIAEYHQKNLHLVESYAGMTVDEFLNLSADQAKAVVVQNIQSLLLKSHSLV